MLRLHGATKRNILVTETTKPACAGFEAVRRRLQALRTKVSGKFGLGAGERDLVALILALSDKAFKLPGPHPETIGRHQWRECVVRGVGLQEIVTL